MITKNVLKDAWKGIDFSEYWNDQLVRPSADDQKAAGACNCNIPNLDTHKIIIVNGAGGGANIDIPANQQSARPLQIQSVVNMDRKALVELHNVIRVGSGAKVQIIH